MEVDLSDLVREEQRAFGMIYPRSSCVVDRELFFRYGCSRPVTEFAAFKYDYIESGSVLLLNFLEFDGIGIYSYAARIPLFVHTQKVLVRYRGRKFPYQWVFDLS